MKKIAVAFLLVLSVLMTSSCMSFTTFEEMMPSEEQTTLAYEYQPNTETSDVPEISSAVNEVTSAVVETTLVPPVQETVPETTLQSVTLPPETTSPAVPLPETTTLPEVTSSLNEAPATDYSSYTKKQIIDEYAKALNKTRSYQGALTVEHTESFTADIKDAHPGGALTELLASNIVKLVGSEGQQTLQFQGGKAVNADGETVPVLLPQKNEFSLPESGVASASITEENEKLHIKMVLVPETVSMGQVPTYNAGAIGYLDTSEMSFSIITISRVDITYTGSVIDAYIGSDGYIDSVTYIINMSTYAELSGMGISGYGTLEGAQTETWHLK